jgi:hypothetical protein
LSLDGAGDASKLARRNGVVDDLRAEFCEDRAAQLVLLLGVDYVPLSQGCRPPCRLENVVDRDDLLGTGLL